MQDTGAEDQELAQRTVDMEDTGAANQTLAMRTEDMFDYGEHSKMVGSRTEPMKDIGAEHQDLASRTEDMFDIGRVEDSKNKALARRTVEMTDMEERYKQKLEKEHIIGSRTEDMHTLPPRGPHCSSCTCPWLDEDPVLSTSLALRGLDLEEYPPLHNIQYSLYTLTHTPDTQTAGRGYDKDDQYGKTLEEAELTKVCRPLKREAEDWKEEGILSTWDCEYVKKHKNNDEEHMEEMKQEYIQPWNRKKLRGRRFCDLANNNPSRRGTFIDFYSKCNILAGYGLFKHTSNENQNQNQNSNLNIHSEESTNPEPIITQYEWELILEEFANNHFYGPDEPLCTFGLDEPLCACTPGEGQNEHNMAL